MKQLAIQLAQTAKNAAFIIGDASTALKNAALLAFADNLRSAADAIGAANSKDLAAAADNKLAAALQERLVFNADGINAAADGILRIVAQDDPIGAIDDMRTMPSGIQVGKIRVPLGVLLMIYESRPNVTVDAAALGLKAGNAMILRGGSEARHTNAAIADCLEQALLAHGLSQTIQVVTQTERELVGELLTLSEEIDLVIPRGGQQLISYVAENARMAVLYHEDGNCHVYVDSAADIAMAVNIAENSKTRRYGVCNAAESLLLHSDIAAAALPPIAAALQKHDVELRVCEQTQRLLADNGINNTVAATQDDWRSEYLAPVISIKIVASLEDAIAHINRYGSAHSDAIVSDNIENCRQFVRQVNSSSVLVNAATGFADGGEYGLGAEIGISTGKLHARGPVGALGLTTQKYVVFGSGHCRH